MRYLFSITLFVFAQVISLQLASVQKHSATKTELTQKRSAAKPYNCNFSKKQASSFKKPFFEDLPFIHSSLKKTGFDCSLSFATQEQFRQYQYTSIQFYSSFLYCCYSFIFNYLYPKHVFW